MVKRDKKRPGKKNFLTLYEILGRRKIWAGAFLSIVGIIAVASMLFLPAKNGSEPTANSAVAINDGCQSTGNINFGCYRQQLDELTKSQSPQKAIELLKQQYEKVSYVKSQCHQLVHVVGRSAYERYGNISDTFASGDKFCWSGYYHGATEQLISEKGPHYAIESANSLCDPIAQEGRQSFYHYNCVHGLGHGFMFALDSDLFKSLQACDSIADNWERTSCYGGVFMQNIMNVQGPDADPNKPYPHLKTSEPMYPCTEVDDKYKGQCYLMQTSYALQTVNYDFKAGFKMCSAAEENYRAICYTSLGRDASGSSISDVDKTKNMCLLGPSIEAQRYCINGAATDFVSYFHDDKQAYQLCESLPQQLKTECKNTVKNYYSTF